MVALWIVNWLKGKEFTLMMIFQTVDCVGPQGSVLGLVGPFLLASRNVN